MGAVDGVVDKAADQLFDRGVLGLVIVLLILLLVVAGIVIRALWLHAIAQQAEMKRRDEDVANELRDLAVKTAEGLARASGTQAALAVATADSNRIQQQMLKAVETLPTGQEALAKALERNGDKMDRLLEARRP